MEKEQLQQLIDKVLSGKASVQEQQQLDSWYTAQENGNGITGEMDDNNKAVLGKQLFNAIQHRLETEPQQEAVIYPMPARRNRSWIVAAAVALILVSGALYYWGNRTIVSPGALASVWKVEKAGFGINNILLPDGSSVWLNAGSSVRYDSNFISGKREVWLQGEAFFDVTHVEGQPFQVYTGRITTRVLGTAFNIDAYNPNEAVTVIVKRGRVTVFDSTNNSGPLLPNHRLYCKQDGAWKNDSTDAADFTAWTSDQLVFRDMAFHEVAQRLERRFGIQIVFKEAGISNSRITASFHKNTPLKDMLDMLAVTNGSKIERGENPSLYFVYGK